MAAVDVALGSEDNQNVYDDDVNVGNYNVGGIPDYPAYPFTSSASPFSSILTTNNSGYYVFGGIALAALLTFYLVKKKG